jgi:hypothetical protein
MQALSDTVHKAAADAEVRGLTLGQELSAIQHEPGARRTPVAFESRNCHRAALHEI